MTRQILSVLIAITLTACATTTQESEYNQGVAAYKIKDYGSARTHWANAVSQGEISALNNLGYLLYYGLGGAADQAQAVSLWSKAAVKGHSESQWHLGQAYEVGNSIPQSNVEAYAWYRCAIQSAEAASADDQTEATIAEDAHKSLTKLLSRLSAQEFSSSEALAKKYIADYAKKASEATAEKNE